MDFKAINWHWLIPEADSPCDIYLHFRGKFAKSVQKGAPLSFAFFEKIRKTGFPYAYLKAEDQKDWENWLEKRNPIAAGKTIVDAETEAAEETSLYGNKRAELVSYMQKVITPKNQNDPGLKFVFENAPVAVTRVIKTPMLDWYFKQFHEPPDLLYHNARVTFLMALFCQLYPVLSVKEQEQILYSSIIHELQGDPTSSLDKVTSALTLDYLEKKQHPVPIEILSAIKMHDELVSGRGYPNNLQGEAIPKNVRVFTFFNHFDHLRLKQTGTRRTRFEATKRALEEREGDYDPALWTMFWEFLEQKIEVTS
jgi:hypothetical protein